jgi:hypothetical protein
MLSSPQAPTSTVHADLTDRASAQRPDLAPAFADAGWLLVRICDTLMTRDGVAFCPGDVALARPAVGRHLHDFIVYSERTTRLSGLRHGEHFAFADVEVRGLAPGYTSSGA